MVYYGIHTAYDVMKEFLIAGAELTELGFPVLPPVNIRPDDTVDFEESFSRKLKGHRKLNCNFFIDDCKFTRLENAPDRYIEHLKCFHSLCGLDFSIDTQMPLVMQMYSKYRSMALDWYLHTQGIPVIPNVNIMPYSGREWLLEGLPKHSTLCCCTNGRIRAKAARLEFCEGFYGMCDRLEPLRVVVIGRMPDELNSPVEIINLKTRNQKINEQFGGK